MSNCAPELPRAAVSSCVLGVFSAWRCQAGAGGNRRISWGPEGHILNHRWVLKVGPLRAVPLTPFPWGRGGGVLAGLLPGAHRLSPHALCGLEQQERVLDTRVWSRQVCRATPSTSSWGQSCLCFPGSGIPGTCWPVAPSLWSLPPSSPGLVRVRVSNFPLPSFMPTLATRSGVPLGSPGRSHPEIPN